MDRDALDTWIRTGDLDELLREIDRACSRRDWADVAVIRDRARAANETGHQLWPAASFAEYRLALDGSDEWAARVVDEGGGYLAPGPLSEVAAQRHTWAALAPMLPPGPARDLFRQERVVRGEPGGDATTTDGVDPAADIDANSDDDVDAELAARDAAGLPTSLAAWEGPYAVANYRADGAAFPRPELPTPNRSIDAAARADCGDGIDGTHALLDCVRHWASHSTGIVRAVCVEGTADDAVATVLANAPTPDTDTGGSSGSGGSDGDVNGLEPASPPRPPPRSPLIAPVDAGSALALLAWAAASGGAQGRRRGMATGRFEAWWCAAVLAGVDDDWPIDIGPAIAELDWFVWSDGTPSIGWECRLAVADVDDGLAWALDATDRTP